MVDLVKIRKKAKEKKQEESARSDRSAAPAASKREKTAAPRPARKRKGTGAAARNAPPASAGGEEPQRVTPPPAPAGPPAAGAEPESATARSRDRLDEFKETAGTRRGATPGVEAAAAQPESGPRLELLSFMLAGEQYAIEIERIAEIISPRPVTPVPNAAAPVVGIISLRGTIVTMLDLRRQLGHASEFTVGPETRTIVVEDGGGMAGFVVDRVLRVVKIDPTQIQSHPIVSPAEQTDAIRGVMQQGDALTIVLDVERLLS